MNAASLFDLLAAAKAECGQTDYVVVGSVSVLGMSEVCAIPAGMTVSIDADCYTLADPPRVFDLKAKLGEGSNYHRRHGIYLDPVSPKLPTLPDAWQQRLIRITRGGVTAHFLEPNDAAVSKLARAEPRDMRWVRAGIAAGLVSLPMLKLRMQTTDFLEAHEQAAAIAALNVLAQPAGADEG